MNNNYNFMVYALVGLAAVAIGSAGWMLSISDADIEPESKAEMYNFIKDTYVNQKSFDSTIFTLENEIKDAIASPHIEFDTLGDKTLSNREAINEMKIDLARLKIQIGGTGTPTQGTISVSVGQTCYERGDVVHLEGMATPSRQLTSSIYITKSVMEYTPTTQTQSNGSYNLFWVVPEDAEIGTYTVKLNDSGGKFGEITVSVKETC